MKPTTFICAEPSCGKEWSGTRDDGYPHPALETAICAFCGERVVECPVDAWHGWDHVSSAAAMTCRAARGDRQMEIKR